MRPFIVIGCARKNPAEIILALAASLLVGCHSGDLAPKPSVQITRVPPSNPGGPEQLDVIEGQAIGAKPGDQIVLFARSGLWWVQPYANQPYTKIQPDLSWKNSTHLGTEYGALLVEPGYRPPFKVATLPREGNGVVATATVIGRPGAPIVSKVIHFSGYDWMVRTAGSDRGGEPNSFDAENVWTDAKGYLHLRMSERDGRWTCGEVNLTRSLGYGTYKFVVQDTGHLGPSAVMGMFTVDEFRADNSRIELDVEMSRWGNASSRNAQYVVQPFYVPENVSRFNAPSGRLTHTIRWEPGKTSFKTVRGADSGPGSSTVSEHVFTGGIPAPAAETVPIDLYDYHHSRNSAALPVEVVVEKFEYLP